MGNAIEIMIVEDSRADFLLISRQLKSRWPQGRLSCVDDLESFVSALDDGKLDLVLFDFNLPKLDFFYSFAYLRNRFPDLPVILVSGSVGEEQAVELLKLGAADFVLKDNLVRLVPAVERALKESADRRARLEAEAARRESEGRFKSLFDKSPVAIGLGEVSSGELLEVNDAWLRLFGYRREEVLGRSAFDIGLYVDDRRRAEIIATLGARGSVVNEAVQLRRNSGEIVDVLYSAELVALDGRPCLQVMMTDVTEQNRSFAVTAASERNYRSLFDNMLEGYSRCRMIYDPQGRPEDLVYLDVNKAFGELTGLHDVVGRRITEVIPGIRESNGELLEIYGRVALTGEPERFESYVPGLGIWFSISVYSMERGSFIAVFDNITADKRAEAAQQATIDLLRICNEAKEMRELMYRAALFFRQQTGCEAVGVRLRDGDDFPYFESSGFPAHFLREENSLSPCLAPGGAGEGQLPLECLCGSVIGGHFDPASPHFSPRGSFWSSCTSRLSDFGGATGIRNRCNAAGYESVALVPLRFHGVTYGLFQFNDRRPGRFSAEDIARYENLVDYISIAFSKLQSDQALLESDRFSQQIIASVREGIIVCGSDLRYRVWNPYMEQLTGVQSAELLGRHPLEVFPFLGEAGVVDAMERALSAGESSNREFTFRRQDCDPLGWAESTNSPLRNAGGELIGVISTVRNITERKAAEESMLLLTKRLQLAISAGHLGIWEWDIRNNSLVWDERMLEMYGITRDTFPGMYVAWENFLHPEDRAMALEAVRLALNGSREYDFEFRIVPAGGAVKHIKTSAVVLRDHNGNAVRMIGMNQDVSDQRQLEEQLLQAQKMEAVGLLAGGISHDFNNMLTAIIGYSALMAMEMADDDPQKSNVNEVMAAAERAADLTRSLLAFSRKQIINPQPADLNEIISRTGKFLRRIIGEDVELRIAFGRQRLGVNVDTGQIEQVLMNLATNARDAMPSGGMLSIDTGAVEMDDAFITAHGFGVPGSYARVAVTDTGIGMDETTRKRLFEPFYTTKEVGKGTGLGMSIVYGIVKQHNGFITVLSNQGQGTVYHLYLPMIRSAAAEKSAPVQEAPSGGGETILVADDEPALRELSRKVLEQFGYAVITAEDGRDAVNKFREFGDRISLVLLDIVMPKMNGKEAMDEIRKLQPESRIILISGYSADIISQRTLLDEGCEVLAKPVNPALLLKKVREVLDK